MKQKKIVKNKKRQNPYRRGHNKGIHDAYEAMELGLDECYCSKCRKNKGV